MTDEVVAYMGWGISAQEQIDGFRKEVRELKAENAKLRELVNLMVIEFGSMSKCSEIPCPECPVSVECDREQQLMRELGVVDQ